MPPINMGIHLYDHSTDSLETQQLRLKAADAIAKAGIQSVVWAEDALSFVFFVPTCLFTLQLLVPDHLLTRAADAVTASLPYKVNPTPHPTYLEYPLLISPQQYCFPDSIRLTIQTPEEQRSADESAEVLLHPQSFFSFDLYDPKSTISLEGFHKNVRFPTRTSYLDSIIATLLDPPIGCRHIMLTNFLRTYFSYVQLYSFRNHPHVLPNGDLEAEVASTLSSLKEENRMFFENSIRDNPKGWFAEVIARRACLERLGRWREIRPFPRDVIMPKLRPEPQQNAQVGIQKQQKKMCSTLTPRTVTSVLHFLRRIL